MASLNTQKIDEETVLKDGLHNSNIGSYDLKEEKQDTMTFPEGGARAWGVALGTAGVLFCTFGFANSFGYVCMV